MWMSDEAFVDLDFLFLILWSNIDVVYELIIGGSFVTTNISASVTFWHINTCSQQGMNDLMLPPISSSLSSSAFLRTHSLFYWNVYHDFLLHHA